jgi:5'-methylthioadenosine phosphorylase
MKLNVAIAQQAIRNLALLLPKRERECECGNALKGAIITDPAIIPPEAKQRLRPIISKYLAGR